MATMGLHMGHSGATYWLHIVDIPRTATYNGFVVKEIAPPSIPRGHLQTHWLCSRTRSGNDKVESNHVQLQIKEIKPRPGNMDMCSLVQR